MCVESYFFSARNVDDDDNNEARAMTNIWQRESDAPLGEQQLLSGRRGQRADRAPICEPLAAGNLAVNFSVTLSVINARAGIRTHSVCTVSFASIMHKCVIKFNCF